MIRTHNIPLGPTRNFYDSFRLSTSGHNRYIVVLGPTTLDKYSIYTVYNFTSVAPLKLIHSSYELFLRNENCWRGEYRRGFFVVQVTLWKYRMNTQDSLLPFPPNPYPIHMVSPVIQGIGARLQMSQLFLRYTNTYCFMDLNFFLSDDDLLQYAKRNSGL